MKIKDLQRHDVFRFLHGKRWHTVQRVSYNTLGEKFVYTTSTGNYRRTFSGHILEREIVLKKFRPTTFDILEWFENL